MYVCVCAVHNWPDTKLFAARSMRRGKYENCLQNDKAQGQPTPLNPAPPHLPPATFIFIDIYVSNSSDCPKPTQYILFFSPFVGIAKNCYLIKLLWRRRQRRIAVDGEKKEGEGKKEKENVKLAKLAAVLHIN